MSISAHFQARNSLTSAQWSFIQQKIYRAELPADEWQAMLDGLLKYDSQAAAAREFFGSMAALAAVIGGICIVVAVGVQSIIAVLLAVISGICFGISFNFFFGFRRIKFGDNFKNFILPAVAILREDIAPESPLEMTLDLRGPTDSAKQTNRLESHGGYPKIVETFFVDRWMIGKASLVDGSILRWEIADHVRERKTTKRNPRGKIKTKKKYQVKRLIKISLGLRQEDYTPALVGNGKWGITLDPRRGKKRNVLRGSRLIRETEPDTILALDPFLNLIGAAFKQVTLNTPEKK